MIPFEEEVFFSFFYADVWGPIPSSSLSGSRYVVVFIVTVDIHGSFFFVPNINFVFDVFRTFHL